MNKFLRVFVIVGIIVSLINAKTIYADNYIYEVFDLDGTKESLFKSESFEEAYSFYIQNIDEYKNICLSENDNVLYMEYGTLYINSDDEKVTYYSVIKEKDVEISNFNEYDLLYINEVDGSVKFVIENDIGYIDKSLVTYSPYGTRAISFYDINNGSMYHHISSSINDYYKYNFILDEAPSFMKENVHYFSYDGHFFYDDFFVMSDDYYNGVNDNSINVESPYYNYYAYLPFRSYTNYNSNDFNSFINNTLGISEMLYSYNDFDRDGSNDSINASALYDTGNIFLSCEKIYGVNALNSLALCLLESNYGKSLNAFENNNLYNHKALSDFEESIGKYSSIKSSIYSHVKNFVSRNYCDLFTTYYIGGFIGDFVSGIGSIYSYNPLFSEIYIDKAYFIDKSLGLKDRNEYSLGFTRSSYTLYYDSNTTNLYKTFRNLDFNSFIVLDKTDEYIKVQNDYSMNQTGEYNPIKCVMYIKPKVMDQIIEGKNKEPEYNTYTIEYSGIDNKILNLYSKNDFDIINDFEYIDIDGYDIESYELVDSTYKPIFKRIKEIKAEGLKYPSIINNKVNVKEGKLHIIYEDNTSSKINLCSENVINVSNDNKSTVLNVMYKGISSQSTLKGNYDINTNSNNIDDFVLYNRNNYSSYSFDDVRNFDNTFTLDDTISTYVRENDLDFSFEGFNPNFIYYRSNILPTIINTYYFEIERLNENKSLDNIISNFNLSYVDSFSISVYRNFYHIDFISPVLIQVKLSKLDPNGTYVVYHKESDGTYTKLPTQFSNNYVRFLSNDDGVFYVYKYNGVSTYDLEDSMLNNSVLDNGEDYYDIVIDGLTYSLSTIFGYFVIAVYYILRRRDVGTWKDFKNSLQKVE